jgi:transcriptional regulator GlxA family with amidase domain
VVELGARDRAQMVVLAYESGLRSGCRLTDIGSYSRRGITKVDPRRTTPACTGGQPDHIRSEPLTTAVTPGASGSLPVTNEMRLDATAGEPVQRTQLIDIVAFDGFAELDVLGPWEVLRTAAMLGAPLEIRLAHLHAAPRTRGLLGLEIELDGALDPDADVVVVPGGGSHPPWTAGPRTGSDRAGLSTAVAAAHTRGAVIASVGTGAIQLSAAGLLHGRPATTHWDVIDMLRDQGADVRNARVVDDGEIITSGGATCGIDLGLHLVRRLAGAEIAYLTACRMEYEPANVLRTRHDVREGDPVAAQPGTTRARRER